jgi:Zn-dependent protease
MEISYKKEAIIAFGGIGVNLLIAFISYLYYYLTESSFCFRLIVVNIFIALFNTIPIDTLDMGRVLRYTLLCFYDESKCNKTLYIISVLSVNLLAIVCLLYSVSYALNPSLVAVTVYLYVTTLFKKWS